MFVKEWVAYFCIVSDLMSGLWTKGDFFCLQLLLREQVSQFIRQSVVWHSVNQLESVQGLRNPFQSLNHNCRDLAVCHQKLLIHLITKAAICVTCMCRSMCDLNFSQASSIALLKSSFNIFSFESKQYQDHITLFCL